MELEDMSEDDDRAPPLDLGGDTITESANKLRNCTGCSSAGVGGSSSMANILENVLENVLHFLTSHRDRNAASLVCKSWYRVEALTRPHLFIGNCYAVSPSRAVSRFNRVKSVDIKGKPRFADFNLMPDGWEAHFTPWVTTLVKAYPWLEKVYLKRMSITDENVHLLARSCPDLKELAVVCCDGFSTSGLAFIGRFCRNLRVLELVESDVDVADDEMDWISFFLEGESQSCLESLAFDCVESPINFEALERLVVRSPLLKKLKCNGLVTIGQLYRLMIQAPQLTHIGTGSFCIEEAMVHGDPEPDYSSAFTACKSLVCLSGFKAVSPEYLSSIHPVCSNLTSLNFSYAIITAEQLNPIIRLCHNLQIFWALDSICDEGLQAVATTCKKLRELRVFPVDPQEDSECPVSEVGFQAISEGCRKLESILYFCQRMTNAAVIEMSNNCQDLVVFRLCIMGRHRPDHVTGKPMDEGFGAIVKNCKKLTRLATSGLLTDRAFSYIGTYGKLIRTLSVAFAGDSDMGLKYVLEGCPRLQKLEIRDSPFGDAALLSGLHRFYNMRFLWMSSCKLTRQGCQEVARAMPRLVLETINEGEDAVRKLVNFLYMYRSLDGPRNDFPKCVNIL